MFSGSVDVEGSKVQILGKESIYKVLVEGWIPLGRRLSHLTSHNLVDYVRVLEDADVVEDVTEEDVPVDKSILEASGDLLWHHTVTKPGGQSRLSKTENDFRC